MFGNDSLPSRIYSYDVINTKSIGINPIKHCEDCLYLCNHYRNGLIALQQQHIQRIEEQRKIQFPNYQKLQLELIEIDDKIEAIFKEIKSFNIENRLRTTGVKSQKELFNHLKGEKKLILNKLDIEKKKIKIDAKFVKFMDDSNDLKVIDCKALSKDYSERQGLFWGFRLGIDKSIPAKGFPKFRRSDGTGRLYFQFQAQKGKPPLTWDRVTSGDYSNICIKKLTQEVPLFEKNKGKVGVKTKNYMVATLVAKGVKIEVPFYMHRPLPVGVSIKECFLIRRKIGVHSEWKIQFIVSKAEGFPKPLGNGNCAIDVNWSKVEEGLLIAWVGWKVDGEEKHKKLFLPLKLVNYYKKTRDLQSLVTENFNSALGDLRSWIDTTELFQIELPDWFLEKSQQIHLWKSPNRLYQFFLNWRNNRFVGDEDVFAKLEVWSKRYLHLHLWQVCQTRKFSLIRDHLYRNFVADLRKQFSNCYIEKLNLAEMKKVPDSVSDLKEATRIYRDIGSPGRFLELIRENVPFEELNAAYTSKRCSKCRGITNLGSEQEYKCEHCGAEWNRHHNSTMNLLVAGES